MGLPTYKARFGSRTPFTHYFLFTLLPTSYRPSVLLPFLWFNENIGSGNTARRRHGFTMGKRGVAPTLGLSINQGRD